MTKHKRNSADPRVRTLLAAAAAPETAGLLPGEAEALAAFRTSTQRTRRTSMLSPLVSAKAAVASAIGTGVLLAGGVGAAAAGVLPGAAQETVSPWLEAVGVSVPADEKSDENAHPRGRSDQTPAEETELPAAADHGREVSETAKNSDSEGADKGKEIAEIASDGRVESGDRSHAAEGHGEPPVSTPNHGGTGTATDATDGNDQSAGAPNDGTATADEASDGASFSGSDNPAHGD
ncbi:MAG: hypothetical protein ACRDPQ_03380 [Nocardioidaceae bacterium]